MKICGGLFLPPLLFGSPARPLRSRWESIRNLEGDFRSGRTNVIVMCPYPIYVRGGLDAVPCGRCGSCLRRNINDWVLRCKWEMKRSPFSYFLTLTYTVAPDLSQLNSWKRACEYSAKTKFKRPLQLFFKRCRKYGFKFRYLAIGDYGDTFGRPHYHVLFFSDREVDTDLCHSLWSSPTHQENGFVVVDRISVNRIRYVVEYGSLAKLDWKERNSKLPAPFFLMSKRPAIGANFLTLGRYRYHRHVTALVRDGDFFYSMPRYYKKKIFSGSVKLGTKILPPTSGEDIVVKVQKQVIALSKHHRDPEKYLQQRRELSALRYLSKMRGRKKQKNKLL